MDFGFINPNALLRIYLREKDLYVDELIYNYKQTNQELIQNMNYLKINKHKLIVADSERPESIEELKRAGYNIIPCKKGQNSIIEGIKHLQGLQIHITSRSTNTIKEIQSYQWKVDKDNNVIETVEKSNDHSMDAIRYVVYTLYYNPEGRPNIRWIE